MFLFFYKIIIIIIIKKKKKIRGEDVEFIYFLIFSLSFDSFSDIACVFA
jgi:hypothetical protein